MSTETEVEELESEKMSNEAMIEELETRNAEIDDELYKLQELTADTGD